MKKLIVDNFAGGGGASSGIELATGRSVDIAINHDPAAIAMHQVNHPKSIHYTEDVWEVDPIEVCRGLPVGLAWFSPDCKHFSKAKGGTPVDKSIRGLAWVALRWAATVQPDVEIIENVEEFLTWGPLQVRKNKYGMLVIKIEPITEGLPKLEVPEYSFVPAPTKIKKHRKAYKYYRAFIESYRQLGYEVQYQYEPNPDRKGETFSSFIRQFEALGYQVEWKFLVASDYGAPTKRKRLFIIARRDGKDIVWPEATHGNPNHFNVIVGAKKPWRMAKDIIDWSIEGKSIFDRKKPLSPNTLKRIARGLDKYVINAQEPFIVEVNQRGDYFRGQSINEHLNTISAKNGRGVVETMLVEKYNNRTYSKNTKFSNVDLTQSKLTIQSDIQKQLFAPFIARIGQTNFGADRLTSRIDSPLTTITSKAEHLLITPYLSVNTTNHSGSDMNSPVKTLTTGLHQMLVSPTLIQMGYGDSAGRRVLDMNKPLGTITAGGNKFGLATAHAVPYIAQHYGGGYSGSGLSVKSPLGTVTASDHHSLVAAIITKHYGTSLSHDIKEPLHTITAGGMKLALTEAILLKDEAVDRSEDVEAFLMKYYGNDTGQSIDEPLHTVTSKARFGLITINRVQYRIIDIKMRMLEPHELFAAQGFPSKYIIDKDVEGNYYSKAKQVARCGNAVPPPFAKALVEANLPELCGDKVAQFPLLVKKERISQKKVSMR